MENKLGLYTYLFSVFCAIIPFTEHFMAVPNILMGLLMVLFPFVIQKKDWKVLNNYSSYAFIGIIVLSLLGTIIFQRWEDFNFISKLITVIVIVLLALPLKDFKKPMIAFLLGSALLLVSSAFHLIQLYLATGSIKLDVGSEVNEVLMGERPFLGFIYLTSICICFFLIKQSKSLKVRLFWVLAILIFGGFILFISARLSTLSLMIILVTAVFYSEHKVKAFGAVLVALVLVISFLLTNETFKSRLTAGFHQEELSFQKVLEMEPRYHIWSCASKIISEKPNLILGYGFRGSIEKLTQCYEAREAFSSEGHREYFVESRFNTHNQYLNFYLSIGWLGLLLFLLFWVSMFYGSWKNYTQISLVLALALFCVFENVLSRQLGAMLFGLVWVMVIFQNRGSIKNS